uniref:Secd/secf/secdf export membrane protein, preprotein translocase subunit SecD n=1 Tax=uncultured archaeon Rifle_16ft_4_minimus_37913 TaxID=1665152 RepID=A0A0H4T6C8_9ARCH|nr:secd/secf/secdf export membrane protein, preprotein translocase subunit SecD [uncultured archaeon Rifle_16ft_4_minimus_37913]
MKLGFRVWILVIVLFLALLVVAPWKTFDKGVLIKSVETNSTAFEQGFRQGQIITTIDGISIGSLEDYSEALQGKFILNQSQKMIFTLKDSEVIYFSDRVPEITVDKIPKTNLKLGLDLVGGSRALVKAQGVQLSQAQVSDLVDVTENRLNEFGLTDLKVRPVSDLEGNSFMLIEIAGATPADLESLISQQGKFEAKIGNQTVFVGGADRDIAFVCRGDPTCARVDIPQQIQGGYAAQFSFTITLTAEAAKRHAGVTNNLSISSSDPQYLSLPLDLYVDDNLQSTLQISKDLKGRVTTQISISGSGTGTTEEEAVKAAEEEMHKLQTILITGSLPYKLEIVKLDTISPVLGDEFTRVILVAGFLALVAASMVVFARYRKIKASLAMIFTSSSEIIIILGIAALIGWNLDLPSIAGILATIGTGFDDQIVILDEARRERFLSLKQRLKLAFAIILGAYFTVVVSMLPLLWAGAGLLKGFAFTTLIGITAGVFITRPAFSDMIRKMEEQTYF